MGFDISDIFSIGTMQIGKKLLNGDIDNCRKSLHQTESVVESFQKTMQFLIDDSSNVYTLSVTLNGALDKL